MVGLGERVGIIELGQRTYPKIRERGEMTKSKEIEKIPDLRILIRTFFN